MKEHPGGLTGQDDDLTVRRSFADHADHRRLAARVRRTAAPEEGRV
jgi:hypothetical protein